MQAAHLSQPRAEPARGDPDDPGRARHDLRPHRRPARDRRADDDDLRRPEAGAQRARDRARGARHPRRRRRTSLYPELLNKKSQFVYVARFADPAKAALFLKKGFAGVALLPGGAPDLPAGRRGRPGARLRRASTSTGSAGSSCSTTTSSRAGPGTQTIVRDPTGRAIDVISSRPVQEGANVFTTLDHTIQAQAEKVLRRHGRPVGREGRDRDRARPVDRRGPRDGADARATTRTTPRTSRASRPRSCATAPSPTPTSRARRSSSSRSPGALSDRLVTPSTRFTLPYLFRYGGCSQCTVHDAEKRGTVNYSVAQILAYSSNVGAVTIAEKLGAAAARLLGEEVRVRLADRHRLPGRERRASCFRSPSGATRRSATCRSGRGSR